MSTNGRIGGGMPGDADRDPGLDRLYHDAPREEPPARLDAAILAAAHREVGARPRAASARLRAWRVPVSIAAVVVLSVSVVTLVREEGGGQMNSSTANLASRSMRTAPAPQAAQQESEPARDRAAPAKAAPETDKARQQEAPGQAASRDDAAPVGAPAAKEESAKRAVAESAKLSQEAAVRRSAGMASEQSAAEPRAPVPPPAAPAPQPPQTGMVLRDPRPAPSTDSASGADMARSAIGIRGSSGETASAAAPEEQKPQAQAGPVDRPAARERAAAGDSAGSLSAQRPAPAPAAKPAVRAESRAMAVDRPDSKARLAPLLKELEPQPADKWVEKIEALRREGRRTEADELLAEFRGRFPDYPLPAALR